MGRAWRAGPFAFDIGRPAPSDWSDDDTAAPDFVVEIAERESEPVAGLLTATAAAELVDVVRPGGFAARIDYGRGTARYEGLFDVVAGQTACPVFESFLRVLCAGALLRDGGALLHASSVIMNGRGWVFCGLSGAGKTTLVDGTRDDQYLTDDQAIVTAPRSTDARFVTWGTPFSGSAARRAAPLSSTVAAVVLLDETRGGATQLVRKPASARTAAELMRHVCAHERSGDEARRALDFVMRVVTTTPVFSLRRNLDDSLTETVARMSAELADEVKAAA